MTQIPQLRLSDGQHIPQIGFGTWALNGEVATQAVTRALEVGYRHLDMATLYDNEADIGRALTPGELAVSIHAPRAERDMIIKTT